MDEQVKAGGQVTRARPAQGLASAADAEVHRRAKHHLRRQILMALTGSGRANGGPGLVARALGVLDQALQGPDPDRALAAVDRICRLLPYILDREGEGAASDALAAALKGHSGPIQIVFGQHFHGRGDGGPSLGQALTTPAMPGQPLTGSSPAEAGAGPSSPASQP